MAGREVRRDTVLTEPYKCDSVLTKEAYKAQVDRWFDEYHYITFPPPRFGVDRSIDQNSLFHMWLTDIAAFLTPCHKKQVTKEMREGTKRTIKGMYHQYSQAPWMICVIHCSITKRQKNDYTSSADWKRGEIFLVLNFMQMWAATIGLILESRGEHAALTRKQNK